MYVWPEEHGPPIAVCARDPLWEYDGPVARMRTFALEVVEAIEQLRAIEATDAAEAVAGAGDPCEAEPAVEAASDPEEPPTESQLHRQHRNPSPLCGRSERRAEPHNVCFKIVCFSDLLVAADCNVALHQHKRGQHCNPRITM